MKILLQNTRTLKYITSMAGWTTKHGEARVFGHGLEAFNFCFNTGMPNMRMVVEFTDSRMNFSLPITDAQGD